MSRGLRSTCSVYDDYSGITSLCYDDDRMFYAGDTFDRCDAVAAQATSSNTYKSLAADKAVNGTISSNMWSFDSLCDAVSTVASNSVSVSSSFDELAARLTALESIIDKEINGGKNSFSNAVSGIKRLTRTGLKTLQYGAR
jgi:hypothetical protein